MPRQQQTRRAACSQVNAAQLRINRQHGVDLVLRGLVAELARHGVLRYFARQHDGQMSQLALDVAQADRQGAHAGRQINVIHRGFGLEIKLCQTEVGSAGLPVQRDLEACFHLHAQIDLEVAVQRQAQSGDIFPKVHLDLGARFEGVVENDFQATVTHREHQGAAGHTRQGGQPVRLKVVQQAAHRGLVAAAVGWGCQGQDVGL